jgi:general secretion pathway protein M
MNRLFQKISSLKFIPLLLNLQRREKIIVSVGAIVLLVLLFFYLIVFPINDRRAALKRQIISGRQDLIQIRELKAEYEALTRSSKQSETQLKRRQPGFTLFSFLDGLAGKSGLKQSIGYMRPSTSNLKGSPYSLQLVEMKIDNITMDQLVAFLHGVETTPYLVWIKRLAISKGEKENSLLDATLQVETFQL